MIYVMQVSAKQDLNDLTLAHRLRLLPRPLGIDNEGYGRHGADGGEPIPDVVGMGRGGLPLGGGGKLCGVGAIGREQDAREAEAKDGGQERVQVAEAQVEAFLALGCLQGEELHVAGRNETLGHGLHGYADNHHDGDGVHAHDVAAEKVACRHNQGREGYEEHAHGHGGEGLAACHETGDEVDKQHHDKGVDIGYPAGTGRLASHADDVLGHGGIHLVLNHPEAGDDEDEQQQAAVGEDLAQAAEHLGHALALAGGIGRMEEEEDGDEGHKAEGGGEEVDVDVGLVAHHRTERVDKALAREGADVDHHVEDGVAARTRLGGSLTSHGGRYDGLDERAANDKDNHDGHDEHTQVALLDTRKLGLLAIDHQPRRLQHQGQHAQPQVADGEQGEGYQDGLAIAYLVGKGTRKHGQEIETAREQTGDKAGFEVVEAQGVGQIKGDNNKDGIVGHTFKQFRSVGSPKRA